MNHAQKTEQCSLITGERLQGLADVTLGANHNPNVSKFVKCSILYNDPQLFHKLSKVKTLFVYPDHLQLFFTRVFPRLQHPIVLMTHNSDIHIDEQYLPYLNSELMISWYAQNVTISHPKLYPLPIGLANSQWGHGDLGVFKKVQLGVDTSTPSCLLYVNFSIHTNSAVRRPIYDSLKQTFAGHRDVTFSSGLSYEQYLRELKQSRFCAVPPGNGIDCHRTWECLYMGVIPIVQRHTHNEQLVKNHDLPMVMVDNWEEVTIELLDNEWARLKGHPVISNSHFQRDTNGPLSLSYWVACMDITSCEKPALKIII